MKSLSLGLNRLTDIENVLGGICHMKNLKDLVLSDNPTIVEEYKEKFRLIVLSKMQQLKYFNNLKVTQKEMVEAKSRENMEALTLNSKVTPNPNDLTHPLEIIVTTFANRVQNDNSKDFSALNQCWSLINKYIRKSLELKDEFSHRLGVIRDEIKTRIRHTVEDLVRRKNELISVEKDQHEKQKQSFDIMDQENYLSRQNQGAIDVIKENLMKKYFKSKQEVQQKTIESLMDVMQSLRRVPMASEKNDEEDIFHSIKRFETDIKLGLERLDEEDEATVHTEVEKLLLDLEVKHNIRVCQIVDILKQLN